MSARRPRRDGCSRVNVNSQRLLDVAGKPRVVRGQACGVGAITKHDRRFLPMPIAADADAFHAHFAQCVTRSTIWLRFCATAVIRRLCPDGRGKRRASSASSTCRWRSCRLLTGAIVAAMNPSESRSINAMLSRCGRAAGHLYAVARGRAILGAEERGAWSLSISNASRPLIGRFEREWRVRGRPAAARARGAVALVETWRDADEIYDRFDGHPPCAGVIPLANCLVTS